MISSWDDFSYAFENTRILRPPQRKLETFGTTQLNYYLITEEMDAVNQSKVREGQIAAQRPEILTPAHLSRLLLEGFGEKAQHFVQMLSQLGKVPTVVKYGFNIKKAEIRSYTVHEPIEFVVAKVEQVVEEKNDPLAVILVGIDDSWEVCLVKLLLDLVTESGPSHFQEFRRKGLI